MLLTSVVPPRRYDMALRDAALRRRDEVDDAARAADPRALECRATVDVPHGPVARRGRIVRDDVARGGEPDDDEQMPVRSGVVEEPRQRAGRVRDRRDERNAGGDIPLGVVQRTELQHPRGKAEM